MKFDFPVEQTVKARYSVRTYQERPLSAEAKEQINACIASLSNPFSVEVRFRLLETETAAHSEKLGTYGMIKGAKDFIGAAVPGGAFALEALGYDFEKLILYAAHLGLGTCWLGGTFNRSKFAAAMHVTENELFPAVSPVGYPAPQKRLAESLARRMVKADQRKDWGTLFFKNNFTVPLEKGDAGEYLFPLEMLRLAPSASNKQPWRILLSENAIHFYEAKTPGYSDRAAFDIQRVDMGIAACHFHLAALEKGMPGTYKKLPEPKTEVPEHMHYLFSWVPA